MQKVDIDQLRKIVKEIILLYLIEKEKNKDEELQRVKDILDNFPIEIKEKKSGSTCAGYSSEEKISMFEQSDVQSYIFLLIHEFFHKISKTPFKNKIKFVEEGIVSTATAEAITYVLSKKNREFDSIFRNIVKNTKSLKKSLESCYLGNAYKMQSSIVRCNNTICRELLGVNTISAYLFNDDGFRVLSDYAYKLSQKYGAFFESLKYKINDTIYDVEEEAVIEQLDRCNLNNINEQELDIEINRILIRYLVWHSHYANDYENLPNKNPNIVRFFKYKKLHDINDSGNEKERIRDNKLGLDELREYFSLLEEISNYNFSIIEINIFIIKFTFLVLNKKYAYEDIKDFIKYLINYYCLEQDKEQYFDKLIKERYIPYIEKSMKDGLKEKDIIYEYTRKCIYFDNIAREICEEINEENFWIKVEELIKNACLLEEENPMFDGFFTSYIYITSKSCLGSYFKDKSFEDINQFKSKLNELYNKYFENIEFYRKEFYTSESIAIIRNCKEYTRF